MTLCGIKLSIIVFLSDCIPDCLRKSGSDNEYRNEYAYSVDEPSHSTISVTFAGVAVNMLIDSGATCNIINTEFHEKLVCKGLVFTPCRRKLNLYNSRLIIIKEMVTAEISLKDSRTSGKLLVVEGNAKPLLSKSSAESLGVLRMNANYVAGEDEFSDQLLDKFPKLWDGIGCLRRAKVTSPQRPFCTPESYKI